MKKIAFLFSMCALVSCGMTPEEKIERAEKQRIKHEKFVAENAKEHAHISDRALCMNWMTSYSGNVNQYGRETEIKRRKLDCWEYGNVAVEQRIASCEFDNALRQIAQTRQRNCRKMYSENTTVVRIE